jgi:Holliday junction resolvase
MRAIGVAHPHQQLVTDEQVRLAYRSGGSIDTAAASLGITRTSVHERLVRLGIPCHGNGEPWTDEQIERLKREYAVFRSQGRLRSLAEILGHTYGSTATMACSFGLGASSHQKLYSGHWKYMSREAASPLFEKLKKSRLGITQFCTRYGFSAENFSNAMRRHFADEWDHVVELKAPKTSLYRLGRQVEYAVRDDLKKRGYPVVLRSPRSGGPVDVLALKSGTQILVQAKRNLLLGVSEWNTLFRLALSVGAIAVLAGRPTGRGLIYMRLDAEKTGRSRDRQPMTRFEP